MTAPATPGRLEVDFGTGHVTGPASISYNNPFPCVNGTPHATGAMQGVLMHTMVGDLPGTIKVFNDPSYQASAHFGIAQDGHIHQFGPLGKGWMAWHAMAANLTWYGIEHADHGHPDNPLTPEQIAASAQLAELLSRFAGFPLRLADHPAGRGYGTHSMGGAAWGGHTCPDLPPQHVRSAQRPAIIALAWQIRNASGTGPYRHLTIGGESLAQIASARNTTPQHIAAVTAAAWTAADLAGLAAVPLPPGLPYYTSSP